MKTLLIGCLALFLAGCHRHSHDNGHTHDNDHSHDNSHEDAHSHAEDMPVLSYTIYSQHTELFVEFKQLVVGHESHFAAHFTMLGELFRPVAAGTVVLTLRGTPGTQSVTASAPEVPGIFRLQLTPEKQGVYDLIFDIQTPAYTDQIVIDSVTVYATEDAAASHQPEQSDAEGGITYLKEQAWKADFATMPVRRQTFHGVVRTSGLVTSAPGAEHTVVSRTAGIITFQTLLIPGTSVSSGQTLFSVSSAGFTDQSIPLKLQEASIALEKAKADYVRVEALLNDQLATRGEFLQVKSALDNAQAVYDNLTGSYGQQGQRISSGQSGYLKSLLVSPGQFVEAGQPLAVISQTRRLTIKVELSQNAYAKTGGTISSANFKVLNDRVYTLDSLNGRLLSVGKFTDNALYIPVWFEIDNGEGLLPGTYTEVFLHTRMIADALVIPLTAVMEEQGNYYCYVQVSGESFDKRQLTLGAHDGIQVHVLSGLSEGERVVTSGAYHIKLSTASGTLPAHGHSH